MEDGKMEVLVKNIYKIPDAEFLTVCLTDLEMNLARKRCLLMTTGQSGAVPIIGALSRAKYQRPPVHKLLQSAIEELGAVVEKVVIDRFEDGIFYADIIIVKPDKRIFRLDSKPTDALALALCIPCPIYVDREIWKKVSIPYLKFFPEEAPSAGNPKPERSGNTGEITLEEMPTYDLKKMEQIFKNLSKPDKDKIS